MKLARGNTQTAYSNAQRVIGVDWQHGQLYLAECRQRSAVDFTVMAVNAFVIPPAFATGTTEFAAFLKEKLQQFCGMSTDVRLIALLPEYETEQYFYRIPLVPQKEKETTAVWMAQKELAMDEKQMFFDLRILGECAEQGAPKLAVAGVSAIKTGVQNMQSVFSRAGYRLEGAISSAAAERNLFASGWAKPDCEQYAVVEVSEDWTRIDIYSGKNPIFSRMLRTGFSSVTRDILESYAAEKEQGTPPFADAPLRKLLLADSSLLSERRGIIAEYIPDINKRLEGTLERLTRQVERTFEYFTTNLGYSTIEHIYLATPGGCMKMLCDYFTSHFGTRCTPLHSIRGNFSSRAQSDTAALGSDFQEVAWCIGLALGHPAFTLNLIQNYEYRRKEAKQRKVSTMASLASMLVVGFTAIAWMFLGMERDSLLAQENNLSRQLAAMGVPIDEQSLTTLSAQVVSLRRSFADIGKRQAGAALLSELSRITPNTVNLTGLKLSEGGIGASARRAGPAGKNEDPPSAIVQINGYITGDILQQEASLADFLYQLELLPIIAGVSVQKIPNAPEVMGVLQFIATIRLV